MRRFLLLKRLQVQNANAVAGLTWGFPAISHFLGFTHALDRKLRESDLSVPEVFGGCAIICHKHQAHTKSDSYGTHHFSLTRNPLTKEGKTASFNEEGRMYLEVSLLVELTMSTDRFFEELGREDILDDQREDKAFIEVIENEITNLRVAGGQCVKFDRVQLIAVDGDEDDVRYKIRRVLFGLLPGFAIVDRTELLQRHFSTLQNEGHSSVLEAWMDFGGLRFHHNSPNDLTTTGSALGEGEPDEGMWERLELPERGWFVPLMLGYQPIAPLQEAGSVRGSRDTSCQLCPVEAVYGVGQWIAPFRVENVDTLLWRYVFDKQGYHFQNGSQLDSVVSEN